MTDIKSVCSKLHNTYDARVLKTLPPMDQTRFHVISKLHKDGEEGYTLLMYLINNFYSCTLPPNVDTLYGPSSMTLHTYPDESLDMSIYIFGENHKKGDPLPESTLVFFQNIFERTPCYMNVFLERPDMVEYYKSKANHGIDIQRTDIRLLNPESVDDLSYFTQLWLRTSTMSAEQRVRVFKEDKRVGIFLEGLMQEYELVWKTQARHNTLIYEKLKVSPVADIIEDYIMQEMETYANKIKQKCQQNVEIILSTENTPLYIEQALYRLYTNILPPHALLTDMYTLLILFNDYSLEYGCPDRVHNAVLYLGEHHARFIRKFLSDKEFALQKFSRIEDLHSPLNVSNIQKSFLN